MTDRPTPWGIAFAGLEHRLDDLEGADDPATFATLPTVRALLSDLEEPALVERNPLAATEYLHLLFAVWRHRRAGHPINRLTRDALRAALATAPPLAAPGPEAIYLQFPERWFWLQPDSDGVHEPLDGLFVIRSRRGQEWLVVAVLGLHPGRAGFSLVSLSAHRNDMAVADKVAPAERFAPAVPGGDAAGLHSVRSGAELLLLVRVALAAADA